MINKQNPDPRKYDAEVGIVYNKYILESQRNLAAFKKGGHHFRPIYVQK